MRTFLFSLSIVLYASAFILLDRWNLPRPADSRVAYVDDFTFILFFSLVIHLLFLLPSKPQHVLLILFSALALFRRVWLFLFVLLLQLVMIGEWWYFEFYRDYIHYASIGYIGDWREIARGLSGFQGRFDAIWVSAILLLVLYVAERFWRKNVPNPKKLVLASLFFAVMGGLSFVMYARLYIQATEESWQTERIPLALKNPILELVREKYIAHNHLASITSEHISALKDIYGERISSASSATKFPFYVNHHDVENGQVPPHPKTNVIFIVMESFRFYETGFHNGYSLTPNFDRIAANNFSADNFYANSNQTIKGELAVLCGLHDFLVGTSISAYDTELHTRCLPQILHEQGYRTLWFHGGYKDFYSRDTFFPRLGFDTLIDREVIENSLYAQGKKYFIRHWGIEDPYVYDYALKNLEQQKQPFFAEIMTLSSHHPFFDIENRWDIENFPSQIHGDMKNMYRKYQHALFYADRSLGGFWDAFSKSPLYGNTLVVIVGDHGIWLFPDGMTENASAAKLYEAYVRLPLAIYLPGSHAPLKSSLPMSQVDIPELVAAYLGVDDREAFQSGLRRQDALALLNGQASTVSQSNPVFATMGDNFFFRQGDKRCYPTLESKGECSDYLYRCVKQQNVPQTNKVCSTWQGDILYGSPDLSPASASLTDIEKVADYFRNSLFLGSIPTGVASVSPPKAGQQ
jgi:phosphoglycerol transferase MdoB-like AlkP superfamily enzyme